jgi:hypothetical protein
MYLTLLAYLSRHLTGSRARRCGQEEYSKPNWRDFQTNFTANTPQKRRFITLCKSALQMQCKMAQPSDF